MSNDTWNTESDNLFAEELSDAELADVQGGSYVFNFGGVYAPYITQVQEQVAFGNVYSTVVQSASQNA
jgi:hypothetical protein